MFPGKNGRAKKALCQKISEVIAETLGCKLTSVSVAIKDVPEASWKEEVWDKEIKADKNYLFKEPGYTCE